MQQLTWNNCLTDPSRLAHQGQTPVSQGKATNTENGLLGKISQLLGEHCSLTDKQQTELKMMCRSYLGFSSGGHLLTPLTFRQHQNNLLELALELRIKGNEKAAGVIAEGIDSCHPYVNPVGIYPSELNYYLGTKGEHPYLTPFTFIRTIQDAADQGNRKIAQFFVGQAYLEGKDIEMDVELAAQYLKKSADQAYQPAIDALKALPKSHYEQAQEWENTDPAKALKLYKEAANKDNNVDAMFRLGELSRKDPSSAIKWFKQADEKGHPKAPLQLAELFASQYRNCTFKFMNSDLHASAIFYYGKSKEASAAFECLQFKADTGDKDAQCELGKFYLDKANLNLSQSEHYLKLAADEGHGEAAYILFEKYSCSLFASSNPAKLAAHYHAIAVKAGHPLAVLEQKARDGDDEALHKLYESYSNGDQALMITPNPKEAEKYGEIIAKKLKEKAAAVSKQALTEHKKREEAVAAKREEAAKLEEAAKRAEVAKLEGARKERATPSMHHEPVASLYEDL